MKPGDQVFWNCDGTVIPVVVMDVTEHHSLLLVRPQEENNFGPMTAPVRDLYKEERPALEAAIKLCARLISLNEFRLKQLTA